MRIYTSNCVGDDKCKYYWCEDYVGCQSKLINCEGSDICTDYSCDPLTGGCISTSKNCNDGDSQTWKECYYGTGTCGPKYEYLFYPVPPNNPVGPRDDTRICEIASLDLGPPISITYTPEPNGLRCGPDSVCMDGICTLTSNGNGVPQFSTLGIILTLIVIGLGAALILKKKK
jgi:hypothetical protein